MTNWQTPKRLAWRTVVLAACAGVSFVAIQSSIARVSEPPRLTLAQKWAGGDARVLAQSAVMRITGPTADTAERALGAAEARRALARDLTVVDAYAALGTYGDLQKNPSFARKFMTASDALSRRNLLTRVWFIKDALERNDVDGALGHFDLALRTSSTASTLLFPILTKTLGEEKFVQAVTRQLQKQPRWAGEFLYAATNSNTSTVNISRIYAALNPKPDFYGQDLGALIMSVLLAQKNYTAALQFNQALNPGQARQALINDPRFERAAGAPPFTWNLGGANEVDAVRSRGDDGQPGLQVTVHGGDNAVIAEQLLALPAGNYRFENAIVPAAGFESRAVWALSCADTEAALESMPVGADKPASQIWNVPANCGFQWLRLRLDSFGAVASQQLFVKPVSIKRL